MPFLWLVQTSSTGGQRSCCHDETCLTLYEGDDRQLWMDFCTWMKANEHKIKLQKRKNKSHALTSSNERIDQNSNIWSEWYTNMSDRYIQENHEKSKSGTMRRQLWQKRFWGGLSCRARVAAPLRVIELKLPEICRDLGNTLSPIWRMCNVHMTHFKIEVRSLCKGVSKILTAYRI